MLALRLFFRSVCLVFGSQSRRTFNVKSQVPLKFNTQISAYHWTEQTEMLIIKYFQLILYPACDGHGKVMFSVKYVYLTDLAVQVSTPQTKPRQDDCTTPYPR